MKKYIFCFLAFFLSMVTYAQKAGSIMPSYTINLSKHELSPFTSAFSTIVILDKRFDTSKVGFINLSGTYQKLVLPNGLPALNEHISKKNNSTDTLKKSTLVIVVKKLWLNTTAETDKKVVRSSEMLDVNGCTSQLESYLLYEGQYTALLRIDSTFSNYRSLRNTADDLLVQPFINCIEKVSALNLSLIEKSKRKFSWEEVEATLNKRMAHACFQTSTFPRGVFLSFADFRKNKISYPAFEIEKGTLSDELYITQNGTKTILENFWGFSDGEKLYIKLGYNFYDLTRQGNTYDFWGSDHLVHHYYHFQASSGQAPAGTISNQLLGSPILNRNKIKNHLQPLQVDMDTGEAY